MTANALRKILIFLKSKFDDLQAKIDNGTIVQAQVKNNIITSTKIQNQYPSTDAHVCTSNVDGSFTITGQPFGIQTRFIIQAITNVDYVGKTMYLYGTNPNQEHLQCWVDVVPVGKEDTMSESDVLAKDEGNGVSFVFPEGGVCVRICARSEMITTNPEIINETVIPMLCLNELRTDYITQEKSVSNQVITNRDTIGTQRKNLLVNNCRSMSVNIADSSDCWSCVVNSDKSMTFNGVNNTSRVVYWNLKTGRTSVSSQYNGSENNIPPGTYILSGGHPKVQVQLRISSEYHNEGRGYTSTGVGEEKLITINENERYVWGRIFLPSTAGTIENVTVYPMLRRVDEDSSYEPGISSLQEQINNKHTAGIGEFLSMNADLNDYTTPGTYHCNGTDIASSLANVPFNDGSFRLDVFYVNNDQRCIQIVTKLTLNSQIHVRTLTSDGWGEWKRFAMYNSNYTLRENDNLNDFVTEGVYYAASGNINKTLINRPVFDQAASVSARLEVCPINSYAGASVIQKYYPNIRSHGYYMRIINNSTWGSWFFHAGVEVETYNPGAVSSSSSGQVASSSDLTVERKGLKSSSDTSQKHDEVESSETNEDWGL